MKMKLSAITVFAVLCVMFTQLSHAQGWENGVFPTNKHFMWITDSVYTRTIGNIAAPNGCLKDTLSFNEFGSWLQLLPMHASGYPVHEYSGKLKLYQKAAYAVLVLDVGKTDLQQCADAILRLRSEFFKFGNQVDKINFHLTNGEWFPYKKWLNGYRSSISNNKLVWTLSAHVDTSYRTFRQYLKFLFTYAGTTSLIRHDLNSIKPTQVRAGDLLIHGGFPGHGCLVVNTAKNLKTGKRYMMLAESFMPAQEMYILANPDRSLEAWFEIPNQGPINHPLVSMDVSGFKRFKGDP